MAEPPNSGENTIEVSLSLLSSGDSQAAKDLAAALSQTAEFFKTFEKSGFKEYANELRAFTDELKKAREQGLGASSHASHSPTVRPPSAAETRQRLGEQPKRGALHGIRSALRGGQGTWEERFMRHIDPQNDEPYDESMAQMVGQQGGGGGGRRSSGASAPDDGGGGEGGWLNQVRWPRQITRTEAFAATQSPFIGEFRTQHAFQAAARRAGRRAYNAADDAQRAMEDIQASGVGTQEQYEQMGNAQAEANRWGNKAAFRDFLGNTSANLSLVHQQVSRWHQRAAAAMNLSGAQALGYGQTGNAIGWGGFGIRDPFAALTSPASREALGARWEGFKLGLRPGISPGQGQQIEGELQGQGFGGTVRTQLANDVMAPAMQRYGLSPNNLAPLLQSVRTGATDIQTLNHTIDGLGNASRAASLTMEETIQQISQVGEAVQAQGGTFMGGVQRGMEFQTNTGLRAGTAATLGENGFVQANLMRRGYIPGLTSGLANAQTFQAATMQSLEQMMGIYRGSFHGIQGEVITDAHGNSVRTKGTSAEDQQIAASAQALGITFEEAKRLWRQREHIRSAEVAHGQMANIQDRLDRVDKGLDRRLGGHGISGGTQQALRREAEQKAIGQNDWSALEKTLHDSGAGKQEVADIMMETDPQKRLKMADSALRKYQEKDREASIRVKFTGAAAKYFEQDLGSGGGGHKNAVNKAAAVANDIANTATSILPVPFPIKAAEEAISNLIP